MRAKKDSYVVKEYGFCAGCGSPTTQSKAVSLGVYKSPHGHSTAFRLLFCPQCYQDNRKVEDTIHRYVTVYEKAMEKGKMESPPTGYKETARIRFLEATYRLIRRRGHNAIQVQVKPDGEEVWKTMPLSDPDYWDVLQKLKAIEKGGA
jgi:hypothetical protein